MKQSKIDESQDMEITDEELTAVYCRAADVSDRAGRESEKGEGEGGVKAAINLMEKSNTKQIHSSKLDAPVAPFSACAEP